MSLFDTVLWVAGIGTEILLIGALSMRGIIRRVPTFLMYTYWIVINDLLGVVIYHQFPGSYYLYYKIQITCDGLFLCLVLLDLTRSVLRPLPVVSARGILFLLLLLTVSVGSMLWRMSDTWTIQAWSGWWHTTLRLGMTFSLVRILFLLLMAGLIQFLTDHFIPVGWGDRELQIATGIGAYALVSVAASFAHTYFLSPTAYRVIEQGVSASYYLCLVYWLVCFLRPEYTSAEQTDQVDEVQRESRSATLWQPRTAVSGSGAGVSLADASEVN